MWGGWARCEEVGREVARPGKTWEGRERRGEDGTDIGGEGRRGEDVKDLYEVGKMCQMLAKPSAKSAKELWLR